MASSGSEIDFIRDELRDEISYGRKQQRYTELNKNRKILGESNINTELTEEFVQKMANSLKKRSLTTQEYNNLQNALIQNENNINAFFKVNHALQGLIRDLSGLANHSKLAAANCCCNLALGNPKSCFTLCKFAAPYLIAELEGTSQPLIEVCAWTIGNLVSECKKAFLILHSQGCLKSLINLAQQCSDDLLPAVSYACVRYIHIGVDNIETPELVKLGQIITQRYHAVSDNDTMWLLAILSSISECSEVLMPSAPRMCDYLIDAISNESNSLEKVSAALRFVCNMISEPSGHLAHCLLKGESEQNRIFIDKLLCHQYIHIRQESVWLLGNLYNHNLDSVQQLIKPFIFTLSSLNLAVNSFNEIT